MNVTFSFVFYSRYANTRTSKFRKVMRQHTEGVVGSIIWIWLEFTSLSGSERISKIR